MITRSLRHGLERQEGQALVLACLMMLVLSLALVTTVHLGHGVHERIRLQNTADAAAYSTAALEARAFNFYAFSNRAQASHYVSAMMWQSLDSFLFSVQAFLTDIHGFVRTIGPCVPVHAREGVFWGAVCALLDTLPAVSGILLGMELVHAVLQGMLLMMKPLLEPIDQLIGRVVVPGHQTLNAVMAGVATSVMLATSRYVQGTSSALIAANDPNVDATVPRTLSGRINQCLFARAHFKESNGTPSRPVNPFVALDPTRRKEREKVARAKRVMAGISNATRFACDTKRGACPETLVTQRQLGSLMPIPQWLRPLEALVDGVPKWGQTRLLTYRLGHGASETQRGEATWGADSKGRNKLRESRDLPDRPMGMLAQGDVLGSDDPYYLKLPGPTKLDMGAGQLLNPFRCPKAPDGEDPRTWRDCWGDPREHKADTLKTSIWAMSRTDLRPGGIHWRVVFPGEASRQDDRDVGLSESRPCLGRLSGTCLFRMSVYVANVRIDPKDTHHDWPGMAPFPHLEPGDYAADCGSGAAQAPSLERMAERKDDFNQPSTWVLLHKDTGRLHNDRADATGATRNAPGLLGPGGRVTFALDASPETLALDNERMTLPVDGLGRVTGMSVISRGQTYYHRPGNWTEQPNFFNPYWRPRLAAIWQGRESLPLVHAMTRALPGALQDAPAKLITH